MVGVFLYVGKCTLIFFGKEVFYLDGFNYFPRLNINKRLLARAEAMFNERSLSANLFFDEGSQKAHLLPRYYSSKRPVIFIAPSEYIAYEKGHPFCPFGDNLINKCFDAENSAWKKLVFLIEDRMSLPADQNLRNVYFGKAELHSDLRSGSFWTFEYAEPRDATHVLFETYHSAHPVSIPFKKSENLLDFGDFYEVGGARIGCYILTSIVVTPRATRDEHRLIKSITEGPAMDYAEMFKEVLVLSYYLNLAHEAQTKRILSITPEFKEEQQKLIEARYSEEVLEHICFGKHSVTLTFGGCREVLYNDKNLFEIIDSFRGEIDDYNRREKTCCEREVELYANMQKWFERNKSILNLLKRHGLDGYSANVDRTDMTKATVVLEGLAPMGPRKKWVETFYYIHFIDSFGTWIRGEVALRYRNLEAVEKFIKASNQESKPKKKTEEKPKE